MEAGSVVDLDFVPPAVDHNQVEAMVYGCTAPFVVAELGAGVKGPCIRRPAVEGPARHLGRTAVEARERLNDRTAVVEEEGQGKRTDHMLAGPEERVRQIDHTPEVDHFEECIRSFRNLAVRGPVADTTDGFDMTAVVEVLDTTGTVATVAVGVEALVARTMAAVEHHRNPKVVSASSRH